MKARHALCAVAAPIFLIHALAANAADVGTAFTYQGNLEKPAGSPVTATCDFRFGLWNSAADGNQVGSSPQSALSVSVSSGVFSATLDFGLNAMDGNARWLEMEVKCPGDLDFNLLSPRLELKPTPYALRASQGVGPPGALEVNGSGGVQLGNETGNQQITIDVNSGTMAAAADSAAAPLTFESRSPTGSRTQIIIDESSSTVTITGSDSESNVAMVPSKPSVGIGVSALGYTILNSSNPNGSSANLAVNTNGGNVGIGTTSPTAKLEIAGTPGVDGVRFPDGTLQTTAASVPPGTGPIVGEIRIWAGPEATIPSGWLLCDGRELLQSEYQSLYLAIGTSWGGTGSTFYLPDLQGRFLRGVNRGALGGTGSGREPISDSDSRVASNPGGNTGNLVGSLQLNATKRPNTNFTTNNAGSHSHLIDAYPLNGCSAQHLAGGIGCNPFNDAVPTDPAGNHSHSITGGGDLETRPANVYVHYIIKS